METTQQNYAKIDSNGVVLEIFENPDPTWVDAYNRDHLSRLRACPPETQVGWVRVRGEFVEV